MRPPALDLGIALSRSIEREEALLWNLKELMVSLDESAIGPAMKLLPRWQIERIERAIESSEEELEMLHEAVDSLEDGGDDG